MNTIDKRRCTRTDCDQDQYCLRHKQHEHAGHKGKLTPEDFTDPEGRKDTGPRQLRRHRRDENGETVTRRGDPVTEDVTALHQCRFMYRITPTSETLWNAD